MPNSPTLLPSDLAQFPFRLNALYAPGLASKSFDMALCGVDQSQRLILDAALTTDDTDAALQLYSSSSLLLQLQIKDTGIK